MYGLLALNAFFFQNPEPAIPTEYTLAVTIPRTNNGIDTPQKLQLDVHQYPVVDSVRCHGPKRDSVIVL